MRIIITGIQFVKGRLIVLKIKRGLIMVYKKFISLLLIFMLIGGQAQTSMAGFQENSTEVSHAEEEPAADSAGAGGANDNEEVSDVHTEEEESIKEETAPYIHPMIGMNDVSPYDFLDD